MEFLLIPQGVRHPFLKTGPVTPALSGRVARTKNYMKADEFTGDLSSFWPKFTYEGGERRCTQEVGGDHLRHIPLRHPLV